MSKRRGFAIAAAVFALIVVMYGAAALQLYFSARGAVANVKTVTSQLSNVNTSGQELSSALARLSSDVVRIDNQITRPIWRPIIWVSGQSAKFNEVQKSVDEARALLEVAPGLLGVDSPRRYLIAFQNSAEARGTGGLIGGFAAVEINKGQIKESW